MSIKPKLGLFDLTMIIVSLVIGVGIFRSPAIVAQKAGTPLIFFTAWLLGGIISICGALTFAEIGSRFPVAGGFYKIFSHCYHPAYAFMLNWSLVIINAASGVGVALIGAEYLKTLLPLAWQSYLSVKTIAGLSILILSVLNYLGIKMGARTQNVLSMVKIAMLVVFCAALLGPHKPLLVPSFYGHTTGLGFVKALGVSLIAIFFTYGGYQNTINFGADVQQPRRNMPLGIFAGIGIVIVLYLLINFAYCSVLGFDTVQNSKLLAADLAGSFLGPWGYTLACVAIFISVLGFINTSLMSNPRIYYAMADDKILPPIFKQLNEKTMTQEFGLTFFVGLMLISLCVFDDFDKIVNYVMFIDSLSLVSAAGTIFIFRNRAKESGEAANDDIFKLRLYPWVPLLFMLVLLIVMINVLISATLMALYGCIIFLAGFPLYLLLKKVVN